MPVRFLHTGDLHLGSPLRAIAGTSEDVSRRLARATQESFKRLVGSAIDFDVDFVVVAGDLYDREARSVRANEVLVEQFDRLDTAGIPAYVVHGNHDPLGDGAEKLEFPPNTHVFGTDAVESVEYPNETEPQARLFGQSYGARHESNKLYYHYSPPDSTVPNIGILHTGLNPDGRRYAPCGPADLASKEIDYWALGHIHDAGQIDGAPGAYCGIPQGRHVGETGLSGCLLVELAADSEPDIEFVPTSPLVWRRVTVDVETAASAADESLKNLTDLEGYLADRALELQAVDAEHLVDHDIRLADNDWEPDGFVYRWELTGRGEIAAVLDDDPEATETLAERLRSRLDGTAPLLWTESVRDRTGPAIPAPETLAENDDVIAELLSLTEELATDPDEREQFREKAGEVWEPVMSSDREETAPDRLALSEARLDDLVDRAREIALEELAVRRNHVD